MADPDPPTSPAGSDASKPTGIPRQGWWEVLVRLWRSIQEHELGLISAGVAFFAFSGFFPALAALVSIYGFVSDPAEIESTFEFADTALPPQARDLILQEMTRVTDNRVAGPAAIIASLLAIWGGSKSMTAFMKGLNIVYREEERRGLIRSKLVSLALTLGAILFAAILVALFAVVPVLLRHFIDESWIKATLGILRWPILFFVITTALSVLYRFGPSRADARWHWISPGACLGAGLVLLMSFLFTNVLSQVTDYSKTYGSLGAVVALLLWFYFTATAVLLGGGLNAQLELQTRVDSTTGPPRPLGERGAFVADHVADRKPASKPENERR